MSSAATKLGHGLAWFFNIKLNYRNEQDSQELSRGESVLSVQSANVYTEEEPTTAEWLREVTPGPKDVVSYIVSLFPFINWIGRYNLQWLIGDLVAGITIGAVVVPQSMAYAKLALLPVQFGLYSAFMGVLIYWFFATSKDITIGPVAVASTITGNGVASATAALPQYADRPWEIASALAVICGAIIAFLGFARLGFIVEFISTTAVSAFVTGAALNILVGQVPGLMGISKTYVNNRASTYLVIIDTLKELGHTQLDAALGLTALIMLYVFRETCNFLARKYPNKAKMYFFISTLRTAFVILLYTLISWAAQNNHYGAIKKKYTTSRWAILGPVPRGFQDYGAPPVNKTVIRAFASQIPATVIVLIIEHIAIAKSFGRINNYVINPSQELLAIGITNLLGPFLAAYPATGSFSRTAIKSKAGVRTPLAGVITAIVVLLAIYALPAVFFWIPNAALSAVIIHAVGDLILAPNNVYQFWRVNPLEIIVFFSGVIVTVFSTIEDGIYTTICVSAAVLLFRLAKARGRFLGKVQIHSVVGDDALDGAYASKGGVNASSNQVNGSSDDSSNSRAVYLPLNAGDGHNPNVNVKKPYPGVFVYRFSEGFNYPNAGHYMDHLVQTIMAETRKTNPFAYPRPGDRPWNDPGPRRVQADAPIDTSKPTLKAVVLDFSSVNNVDVTVVQNLIDVRNQLDRHASPDVVEWHIACVNNRWTKRALVAAGFGYPTPASADGTVRRWKPVYSVAEIGGAAEDAENTYNKEAARVGQSHGIDVESGNAPRGRGQTAIVHGLNRPYFHLDVSGAVQSAIAQIEGTQSYQVEVGGKTYSESSKSQN